MKAIYNLFLIALILTVAGCDDYLDQVPEEKLGEESLFESKDDAVSVLTQAYSTFSYPMDIWSTPGISADALDIIWSTYAPYAKDKGEYGPSSEIFDKWRDYYAAIRVCIYFLNGIDECHDEKLTEQERTWWKGEAYFLEAYYYFLLMEEYGPVPLVDKVYSGDELTSSLETGIARSSMDENVLFVDSLCVEAMNRLDTTYATSDRVGRANASAAAFLRSRLWLYAASPLYNGMVNPKTGKDYSSALMISDNMGNELLDKTFSTEKWAKALEYAEDAIRISNDGGYDIFMGDANYSGGKAYKRLFTYPRGGEPSQECIFYKQNLSTSDFLTLSLPITWSCYSGICPTLKNDVEAYFTADGLLPEDDVNYQNASGFTTYTKDGYTIHLYNKFKNRDPRFYTNILFPEQYSYAMTDGATESFSTKWAGDTNNDLMYFLPYADGSAGYNSKTGRDYTTTGFLCIKWVSYSSTSTNHGDYAVPIFRYSELLLNQMEAAFEYDVAAGIDPSADEKIFDPWDQIRDRVGMPHVKDAYAGAGINLTNDKLRELVHRERRVELDVEGHRYFDNRRWLDGEREGGDQYGYNIMKNFDDGFWKETIFETRYWDDKMYFMPIPQSEIDKDSELTQNPGW